MLQRPGFRHHKKENYVCHASLSRQSTEGSEEVTQLRKLNGSPIECPSHQNLHKELLLSHKRGLLLEEKPELQRVLEQRRLEQHREQELALRPPSDLEQELRKRQQRLLEYEMEEMKRREGRENVPEFVRVKEKLRHIEGAARAKKADHLPGHRSSALETRNKGALEWYDPKAAVRCEDTPHSHPAVLGGGGARWSNLPCTSRRVWTEKDGSLAHFQTDRRGNNALKETLEL
ncbi:hypothetical protein AOLI_G00077520 [Acnodon oligacanthus]